MRSRLLALVVVIAVGASACSGGGSAEEYFADLETATMALDGELDTIEAEFNGGLLDIDFEGTGAESALIALFQTSISATASSFANLVRALEELDPPAEVEASHADAVQAGRRVRAAYDERRDELAAIGALEDIDAYAQSLADSGVRGRFSEACRELQAQADRAGADVALGC